MAILFEYGENTLFLKHFHALLNNHCYHLSGFTIGFLKSVIFIRWRFCLPLPPEHLATLGDILVVTIEGCCCVVSE